MKSRTFRIILSIGLLVGVAGILMYSSMSEAEFYKHVHEVGPELEKWTGKNMRVHGFVEPGSIVARIEGQKSVRTFILESEGERMKIYHEGPKPDTFKDTAEVVAKGIIVKEGGEYVFHASELMAKCPSKYEENQRSKPEKENVFGAN